MSRKQRYNMKHKSTKAIHAGKLPKSVFGEVSVPIFQSSTFAFPDADEGTLVDTLEGLSNLPDMLAEVCRSMLDDQAMVSALRGRISRM